MDMTTGRREDDKTIGEIYRKLVDMDERYEKKLDRIEEQCRLTNGRTTTLEANYRHLHSDINSLRQHQMQPPTPQALPPVPVTTAEGESLSIKVSPKMWVAIVSGMGALWLLAQWAARLIEKLAP